jgi:hypothetical protein
MSTIHSHIRQTIRVGYNASTALPHLRKAGWVAARLLFTLCSALCVISVVGCYLFSPLFTYWFFGSWRFWKYLHLTLPVIRFSYYLAYLKLRGRSVPSFPWSEPPMSGPDPRAVQINPEWMHGDSCGDCGKCCRKIRCPFLDRERGQCLSYNSFYWRYFNCGRYPLTQQEIDLYECPKWIMRKSV